MHPDFTYFYPEQPRRLEVGQVLFEQLSANPDWVAEPKYNGSRLQLYCLDGAWQFWNRHGSRMAYVPSPEILASLAGLNLQGFWLFDGELRHNKVKGIRHRITLYDIFVCAGESLNRSTLAYRRPVLEEIFRGRNLNPLSIAPQYPDNFRSVYQGLRQDKELEGLVLKDRRGELQLGLDRGAPSRWMWKVKYADETRTVAPCRTAAKKRPPVNYLEADYILRF